MSLLALHRIAAQRGEGLRPELVRLLERSVISPAAYRPSAALSEEKSRELSEICGSADEKIAAKAAA